MPPLPHSSPTDTQLRGPSQSSEKKAIPPEKLPRARELYEKVERERRRSQQFEQQLQQLPSQSTMAHGQGGNYLDVPLTPLRSRSRSTTSRSSRASATSSAEVYEDLSQMTSIISFDDGSDHREHHRNPLPPYERAKAHLVRYLEACATCRGRKVKCSLDHHDLSSIRLDPDPEVKIESELQQSPFEPPSLRVEIPRGRSMSSAADLYGYESVPSNSFEYMGSAPELSQDIGNSYAPHLDFTHSAGEAGPFSSPVPNLQASPDTQGSPSIFTPNPYAEETFSDNHVPNEFCLGQRHTTSQFGVVTHTYNCINCDASFLDLDQCIHHFSTTHFRFYPITPPLRLVCPGLQHFFRKYSELQSCFCAGDGPMNVFIYGQMMPDSIPSNEQPSSAISNHSYNSSPNSRGSGYNQPFSNYQSPSWSSNGYDLPYGSNYFGSNGGSAGYKYSTTHPCHTTLTGEFKSIYHNTSSPPPPPSNIPVPRHYNISKSTDIIIDPLKSKHHQPDPRKYYYIPKDHWMFRHLPYFRAASIVSLTLTAMFFAFGHASDHDLLEEKLAELGDYFRGIGGSGRMVWWGVVFAFCCFAVYGFVRHIWGGCAAGGERQRRCPTHYDNRCTLSKITISLQRFTGTAKGSTSSKSSSSYGVGDGSFC